MDTAVSSFVVAVPAVAVGAAAKATLDQTEPTNRQTGRRARITKGLLVVPAETAWNGYDLNHRSPREELSGPAETIGESSSALYKAVGKDISGSCGAPSARKREKPRSG